MMTHWYVASLLTNSSFVTCNETIATSNKIGNKLKLIGH